LIVKIPFLIATLSPPIVLGLLFVGCSLCAEINDEQEAKAAEAKTKAESSYKIPPSMLAAIPKTADKSKSDKSQSKPYCNTFCGWGKHAAGDPVAVFTLLLSYLVFLQLLWMNRQERVLQSSVDVARDAAQAATSSAEAAVKSIDMDWKKTRAYVVPGPGHVESKRVFVTVQNIGMTPAILTSVRWGICPVRDFVEPPLYKDSQCLLKEIPLHAQMKNEERKRIDYDASSNLLGERAIFYARITYLDVIKEMHFSECRHYIDSDGHSTTVPGSYSKMWD